MESDITVRARGLRRNALIAAVVALAGTVITFLVALPSAYAQAVSDYPPPPPQQAGSGGSSVDPSTGAGSGSSNLVTKALASTGSNVALFLAVAAVLLVLGVTALYLARRRSA